MKRLLFGMMLSLVGLSYSLVCFHGVVSNPWYSNAEDRLFSCFYQANTLAPFFISTTLLLIGLIVVMFEAFRKK